MLPRWQGRPKTARSRRSRGGEARPQASTTATVYQVQLAPVSRKRPVRSSRTLLIQQPKLIASERDLLFLDSRPGDDGDLSPIARADQGTDHCRDGASALPSAWATLGGVRLLLVKQSPDPSAIAQSEPHIVLTGGDLTEAQGPTAFHRPSLMRVFRRANGIVIVSPEVRAEVYTLTAQPAVFVAVIPTARARSSNATILTETGLEREIALVALVKKHAPGGPSYCRRSREGPRER